MAIHRTQMRIPSKGSGLIPPAMGLLSSSGLHVGVQVGMEEEGKWIAPQNEKDLGLFIHALRTGSKGTMRFPLGAPPLRGFVTSRFLAKIAVEALLLRLEEELSSKAEVRHSLRPLARHARYGEPKEWGIVIRQAYPADTAFSDGLTTYDLPHEFFFDAAEESIFFFLRIFGVEFALDMGCDDVKRLTDYIATLNGQSPMPLDSVFQLGNLPAVTSSEWTKWC